MLLERIEENLKKIENNLDKDNFIYQFLEAYEQPKSSIKRLKDGDYNLSKKLNEVIWKKKIYYYQVKDDEDIHICIDELSKSEDVIKNKIRFIIVTDFKEFLSVDLKNNSTLDIKISELFKNSEFFLPLCGLEKSENIQESEADIKAAYKMGQLYDILIKENKGLISSEKKRKDLNIFFTRLLFCYFAEDSSIFKQGIFTNSIVSHTLVDGSDIDLYLQKLFFHLNDKKRKNTPNYLLNFPFVNGELFSLDINIPKFSSASRKLLISIGGLDWGRINPDILGSMLQAIVSNGVRQKLGMHYTSVNNILKTIRPLFLDDLYDEFSSKIDDLKSLKKLLKKIYSIKIFDPACGSGNFLVISYKELYLLEIKILEKINQLDKNNTLLDNTSCIDLKQFYGIELDDYAHKSARLSLWIAQHQMNTLYNNSFSQFRPTLPLSPAANIINANSNDVDWEVFCKNENEKKVFIIGNPPYLGSTNQSSNQKKELDLVFHGKKNYKNLDYISCWFLKAADFVSKSNGKSQVAFVSTSSIFKGEQVSMLWPNILNYENLEIGFCYDDFKWSNHAKFNAGVICNIVSLRPVSKTDKFIFKDGVKIKVKNINPYLIDGENLIIEKEKKSISNFPPMNYGNKAVDGGNLILSSSEKENLLKENSENKKYVRNLMGAEEYINGKKRHCLWIPQKIENDTNKSKIINERIKKVKTFRLKSRDKGANKLALTPHRFRDIREAKKNSIIIPRLQSERRKYIIVGFLENNTIIADSCHAIYDPPIFIFSILSSRLHALWTILSGGTHGSTLRYSVSLCYNTFPLRELLTDEIHCLEKFAFQILDLREKYSDKTLSEIYDPEKMPKDLFLAHKELDDFMDKIFKLKINSTEKDKIQTLINEYQKQKNNELLI